MVDSVDNSFSSIQRIQQQALANLKSNQKVAQALINHTQKSAVVPVKFSAVPQTSKGVGFSATPKTPLPRGSLVDRLV